MGSIASPTISGIILAGGLSRRMGQDKAWLPWNGQMLLAHVVGILKRLVKETLVVARPGQALPPVSACLVTDRIQGTGPLGGLEAGLTAMRTPYGMVVACDMPWLNSKLLKAMVALAPGWDLVIPYAFGSYHPLHAIYAKHLETLVARLLSQGEHRLHVLVKLVKARVVEEPFIRTYDPLGKCLRSLDYRRDYEEAHLSVGQATA